MQRQLTLATVVLTSILAFGKTPPLQSAKELQATCTTALKVFEHADDTTLSSREAAAYGECVGYVEAVLDSMRSLKQTGTDGKTYRFHLHGDGFTVKDAVVFFLDFSKTDTETDQDSPAAQVVIRSLTAKQLITTSLVDAQPKH
jgi:hypothetical protein